MTTHAPTANDRALVDTELARIRQVLSDHPGPAADAAWKLLRATKGMLAFPTMTRDMVSRGQVSNWLHGEAAKVLAGES